MALSSDALKAEAAQLLSARIVAFEPARGGGNNRVYRVEADDGRHYALKTYLSQTSDQRDRIGSECHGLQFLWDRGERRVPRLVSTDDGQKIALFDWVDGERVDSARATDVAAALSFVAGLRKLAADPAARKLPLAAEACLSARELLRQVENRQRCLCKVAADHPDLERFLSGPFAAAFADSVQAVLKGYAAAGLDAEADLPTARRTLSPSDFGFHNAMRSGDGLVFIDFEYFGWDDPVKLVADFLLHPGMSMEHGLKRQFFRGAREIFGDDGDFPVRLKLLYPLYGLRWSMILLNEFLPERWQRRAFAGAVGEHDEILQRQLAKAEAMLAHAIAARGGVPYDA